MSGTRQMTWWCGNCNGSIDFPIPDRPAMRETPQTSYVDDPLTIPVCGTCEKTLGAAPAMFPTPSKGNGQYINAFAIEYRARWVDWVEAGCPVERVPFRCQTVIPRS